MPMEAVKLGGVEQVVALNGIAREVVYACDTVPLETRAQGAK